MKVPEPRCSATSPPVPPWNGVPSILPVKSMVTRSPFSALAPSPLAANGRLCSAIFASASSTSASVTSAFSRSSWMPLKSASSIVGRISIAIV